VTIWVGYVDVGAQVVGRLFQPGGFKPRRPRLLHILVWWGVSRVHWRWPTDCPLQCFCLTVLGPVEVVGVMARHLCYNIYIFLFCQ